eukprot:CAMPEP_0197258852 /NCGR_PEP_ID=MMETSP1429-20130617/83216_1 /TAXON_ID=49237 /ORGANISM="Chaetoceros  sp., Strain UNC1202" /LENGTH=311 /DNA_ID=CAMNT_0042723039 /DNA_START=1780 /DNA_END=2711 /DNA_ORIENTATION=-
MSQASKEEQLWKYCELGDYENVDRIIHHGADIHAKNKNDWTALHYTCQYSNNVNAVKLLLDKYADVNAKTKDGVTALHIICCNFGNIDMVKLLLERGVDIHAKDEDGWTALHTMCQYSNNINAVKLLLERGASVNVKTKDSGWTAMHLACNESKIEMAKLLIRKGADISARNDKNKTPLDLVTPKNAAELRALVVSVVQQSLIVHATTVEKTISREIAVTTTVPALDVPLKRTTPANSMGQEGRPTKKRNYAERMEDLASNIGLLFQPGLIPSQRIYLLEEQYGVEQVAGDLRTRIRRLEDTIDEDNNYSS